MRLLKFAAAVALAVNLSACASLGSFVSDVTVSATSATPGQAKTVAEAAQAATLVEHSLDLYVKAGNPSPAVLTEIQVLVTAVHNTLVKAEQANAAGNSALTATGLAAFNQAIAAVNSYETLQGVSH